MSNQFPREQKTEAEILNNANRDKATPYPEFLNEIYKEAYNNTQNPDEKIAKLLAKFSALSVRVSLDNEQTSKRNERMAVFSFGVAFLALIVGIGAFLVAGIQLLFMAATK